MDMLRHFPASSGRISRCTASDGDGNNRRAHEGCQWTCESVCACALFSSYLLHDFEPDGEYASYQFQGRYFDRTPNELADEPQLHLDPPLTYLFISTDLTMICITSSPTCSRCVYACKRWHRTSAPTNPRLPFVGVEEVSLNLITHFGLNWLKSFLSDDEKIQVAPVNGQDDTHIVTRKRLSADDAVGGSIFRRSQHRATLFIWIRLSLELRPS